MIKNVQGLVVVLSGKGRSSIQKRPYLDKDGLPESLDWTIRTVSARSSFLAYSLGKKHHTRWRVLGAKPPSWMHEELHGRSIEDLSILHPSIHQSSINHPSTIHQLSINYPSTIIRSSFDHTSMDIYISTKHRLAIK